MGYCHQWVAKSHNVLATTKYEQNKKALKALETDALQNTYIKFEVFMEPKSCLT
jgi:hypothetical protein